MRLNRGDFDNRYGRFDSPPMPLTVCLTEAT
jgi:hypothetical protein